MDLIKHLEFFSPLNIKEPINIIGCGAIGSNVALQLAKLGCTNLILWDFDTVDEHNITNQVYNETDIGLQKTSALTNHLVKQNQDIKIATISKYTNQLLTGYVFICVDSIELRHQIYINNQFNINIKFISDGRIGLETAQVYNANWSNEAEINNLIELSDFKSDEVSVPVSACGTSLSISPTVLITTSLMIASFINYLKDMKVPKIINIDAFQYNITKIY